MKVGGDFQLTSDGDLKMTRDRDIQLGDNVHNALHRLVVRWQFNVRTLKTLFDFVVGSKERLVSHKRELDEVAARMAVSRDTVSHEAALKRWHELHHEIGVGEFQPEAYGGTVMVVLPALLRREWGDPDEPANVWETAGDKIARHSFGQIVEAAANSFRHFDEWGVTRDATAQQMRSMRVISAVLAIPMNPNGLNHPFRANCCPEILAVLSDDKFEALMDRFFGYVRSLAGL